MGQRLYDARRHDRTNPRRNSSHQNCPMLGRTSAIEAKGPPEANFSYSDRQNRRHYIAAARLIIACLLEGLPPGVPCTSSRLHLFRTCSGKAPARNPPFWPSFVRRYNGQILFLLHRVLRRFYLSAPRLSSPRRGSAK